ncbi:MAG: Fe-S cluster assembly sulfur transfer protein SufU [Legionella sp.]
MELRELYQEIIIDHNRHPRNHRKMANANCQSQGFNPLCGDKVTVYLFIDKNVITDISFIGCGCAISQASASLMTEVLQGKSIEEARQLFIQFHRMATTDDDMSNVVLDKLVVLAGVRAFPARVKCATLAWHTLDSALKQENAIVTTE